jgi:intergrase/recombinase
MACPEPDLNRRLCGLQPTEHKETPKFKIKQSEEISEKEIKTPDIKKIKFDDIDKNDFIRFWTSERKTKTTEKRAEKLYNVLKKVLAGKEISLESLREGFHKTTNKRDYVDAARVLLAYLKNRKLMTKEEVDEILEMDFLTSVKSKIKEVPEAGQSQADIEVAKVLEWIKEKWNNDEFTVTFYKLIVFSGIREDDAYKLLTTFNPAYLEFKDNMARYKTSHLATDIKKSFYAFMPAEFARKLKKFDNVKDLSAYQNRINPKRWKTKNLELKTEWGKTWINGQNLRKWFANFLKRHGVDLIYIKYFMGHITRGVLEHYEMLEVQSWDEYAKVVDKFPIPP